LGGVLHDLIARKYEFTDQVHQPVEQGHVHANRGILRGLVARLIERPRGFRDLGGADRAGGDEDFADGP
jgi:hypothetical protein